MPLGQNIALALNSNLHSARADNLLRVILERIREPATKDITSFDIAGVAICVCRVDQITERVGDKVVLEDVLEGQERVV